MEYVYAAMLLHKAQQEVNEANIKKVLEAAGCAVDEAKVKSLVAALDGVDIEKVILENSSVAVAAPAAGAGAPAEGKKEEKKEEKEEESVDAGAGLGALFG